MVSDGVPRRFFEDVHIGDQLTPLVRGPLTPVHLMRWSAAIENWHRIHYDEPFAVRHDELPALLVNGTWKQHLLVQLVRDWIGAKGWLAQIGFRFIKMDLVGTTLTASGEVTATYERDHLGYIECAVGIRNEEGEVSTSGTALAVLPLRGGRPVPYPFPVSTGLLPRQADSGRPAI